MTIKKKLSCNIKRAIHTSIMQKEYKKWHKGIKLPDQTLVVSETTPKEINQQTN